MQTIIIKNLGPVKECEIKITPITIFIGESGCGKSIILRTVSLLKWIYKKMQYKVLLKSSKAKTDALRFRLDGLLKTSMLEDFFTNDTYIEFIIDKVSVITIDKGKLTPHYTNIKPNSMLVNKIVFLNDNRSSIPEILSSPGGRRAKFSYYTSDMIDNFMTSWSGLRQYALSTMDINLISKKRVGYEQFYLKKDEREIKFENASSGEKSSTIVELILFYFSNHYDYKQGFASTVVELIANQIELKKLEKIQSYLTKTQLTPNLTFFIEEPEANLFPINQKRITEFLVKTMNSSNLNTEIIFSTHSPYILTTLNNLLLAKKISDSNKNNKTILDEVVCIIPNENQLDIKKLSVYEITNGVVNSIVDNCIGLVQAEKIDSVSASSSEEFDSLLEIENDS